MYSSISARTRHASSPQRNLGLLGRGALLSSFLLLLLSSACGPNQVVKTALHGDLPSLRQEIAQAERSGDLGQAQVVELAEAIAGREIRSADPNQAAERIHQLRACAGSLRAVLEDRAEKTDEAGALAKLALIDAGFERDARLVEKYNRTESGAWRAVAARLSLSPAHAGLRQEFMADPDERVRYSALAAALATRDARDLDALLEATRLDPNALNRSLAARAAGNIGGEKVVLGLKDLWARADETTRVTIVQAWAMPSAFKSGGEAQLVWVVETSEALPAVTAAGALFNQSKTYKNHGAAFLARIAAHGAALERRIALQQLPLEDADNLKLIEAATKDADPAIQTLALSRLLETSQKDSAKKKLLSLAKGKTDAAFEARLALVRHGFPEAVSLLKQDLKAKQGQIRQQAAIALAQKAHYAEAAPALADESPSVRTRVACGILLSAN